MSENFRARILLVDDHEANLLALEAALEPLQVDCVTARSGLEALRQAAVGDFALILLDVHLPALDGYETAQLLRSLDRAKHTPIMFLTALHDSPEFVARGYSVGAVDYMIKPLDPYILRSKVEVFVELHRKNTVIREQAEQLRQVSELKLEDYKRESEERYTSLADAMPLIMWTSDPKGAITYRNARWLECAGGNAATDWSAIVHPDDLDAFVVAWNHALSSGQPWEAEFRFCNATKKHAAWHLVRAVPKLGVTGAVTSWVGTITDIDVQKRARQALEMLASLSHRLGEVQEGNQSLECVLQSALPLLGDAVLLGITGDEEFDERHVCAALPRLPKHKLEDLRLQFITATAIRNRQPAIYALESAERTSPPAGMVTDLAVLRELEVTVCMCLPLVARYRVLGSITFFSTDSSRSYAEEDVTLAQDVAHRLATALDNLRLYEIANLERAELEATGHAKDVFLATLSHELRTPLNAIVGWSHILKTGELGTAKRAHAVETIDRNARTLGRLVADLLDVSRIISGNVQLQHVRVDIRSIVETALDAARPSADLAGLALESELPAAPVDVSGDAARLQQVMNNLLVNAIKFTPSGGRVRVKVTMVPSRVRITVSDTGQGISPEFIQHIFDPFRQAQRTHARSHEGLGLGLAIAKNLVERHQGTISCHSEGAGKGSTFTVELPLLESYALSHRPNISAATSDAMAPSDRPTGFPAPLAGLHALVVEDDPDSRDLVEAVLCGFGAQVTSVDSAGAAIRALAAHRPDVLVSDIGLPDEDGLSLIRRIRKMQGLESLPAIALSAYASKQDVRQALAAGFQVHVAKPLDPDQLGTIVADTINGQDGR